MKTKSVLTVFILIIFSFLSFANKIVKAPDSIKGLDAKFNWAKKNSKENKYIIYSIKVLMNEHSHYGSWHSDSEDIISLGEILTGDKSFSKERSHVVSIKKAAKMALNEYKEEYKNSTKKVLKNVAIIFRYEKESKNVELSKISIHTYDSMTRMKKFPLYWLGEVNSGESIRFLKNKFDLHKKIKLRKNLVTAVALHKNEKNVLPFLLKVVKNNYHDKVRGNAIFWLGEYNSPKIINILMDLAKNSSEKLGKKAVFSLYRIKSKKADDGLIEIAKGSTSDRIRKNAIFWLGQKATKRSAKVLGDIVRDDSDRSIQNKAVFALSQLPGDAGITALIKIAKNHKSFKVRKKAIFWLGQSSNPKGLKTIIDILKD